LDAISFQIMRNPESSDLGKRVRVHSCTRSEGARRYPSRIRSRELDLSGSRDNPTARRCTKETGVAKMARRRKKNIVASHSFFPSPIPGIDINPGGL